MSTDLQPDEKRCPFCAETIKAAAVKCRYCGSELPGAAGPAAGSVPDPAVHDAADPAVDPAAGPPAAQAGAAAGTEPRTSLWGRVRATARRATATGTTRPAPGAAVRRAGTLNFVLGLVVVALVVSLFFAIRHVRASDIAPGGEVTDAGTRAAILSQTAKLTESALSYAAATFDADAKRAGELMTPGMRKEYLKTLDKVRGDVRERGMVLKATVEANALVSAGEDEAKVLEFVNQTTTAKGAKTQQLNANRVVVTVVKRDGAWRISALDAF